ncbi:MAG: MopE-related protein [bacterium]
MSKSILTLGALGLVWSVASPARGAMIYVDGQLGSASCTDYDPSARSCGGGADTAYQSIGGAAAVTQPGDEVLIRAGGYDEQLAPTVSGAAGSPITFTAVPGETVSLTGDYSPATIRLDALSYVIIEGLTLDGVRWVEATGVDHIVLRDNVFRATPASGTTGNVRFISSDHNRIEGNVMDDGNDNLLLIDSDRNLVVDNTITEGRHSVLSIRCSGHNIFRGNYLGNSQQKIGEVYDCGADTSAVPNAFDATTRNVFEHNTFAEAVTYYSTSGGNGIQYAGQDGILRRNAFYQTNVGLGMQVYDDEALYNHNNRVYHNVFYDNHCAGVSVRGDGVDNVFKNNILMANRGVSGDCFGVGEAQLLYRNPLAEIFFERNDLFGSAPGQAVIQDEFDTGDTLAAFEASHPALFVDNLEVDPLFSDAPGRDFTLQATSPLIDAGAFLTRTTSAGSGTTLPVADARYFHDGFGIEGEVGDLIQLEGQPETATVTAVDLAAGTITVDVALTWTADQGVAQVYQGDAPDVGLDEVGASECSDGLDNDGDGFVDFPDDPGCSGADDVDETDCGDGRCEGGETCVSCEADCGVCTECADVDGDGYGDPSSTLCAYSEPDCDDDDNAVHPGAAEVCDDGVDNNCDGLIDQADTAACPDNPPDDPGSDGCGCEAAGPAMPGVLLWLLVVGLWLGVVRRQRRGGLQ